MVSERDWVRIRADCTLEQAFSEICHAMISDVEAFNDLAESKRKGRLFLAYPVNAHDRYMLGAATLPSKARHRLEQRCRPRCRAMSGRR